MLNQRSAEFDDRIPKGFEEPDLGEMATSAGPL